LDLLFKFIIKHAILTEYTEFKIPYVEHQNGGSEEITKTYWIGWNNICLSNKG